MNEYEVLIETINPCGGERFSQKEFLEVETDSPEAYVRKEAFPYSGRKHLPQRRYSDRHR